MMEHNGDHGNQADGASDRAFSWKRTSERPGAGLECWTVLVGMAVLALNDHVLKGADLLPSWLTGKLSDFAGLLFFPLLLQALVEVVTALGGWYRGPNNRLLMGLMALTAVTFSAVQCFEPAGHAYSWALAWIQWLPQTLAGAPSSPLAPVAHYADLSDTLGLVSLWGAYAAGLWRPPVGTKGDGCG